MGGLDEAVDLDIDRYLPDRCNVVQKIRDIVRMLRILGNWYVQLLSAEMDSFDIIRVSKQIRPQK